MGLLTDWLMERSRANRDRQDRLNESQAQVYLEAIKSGRLAGNPEALDYANQQVEKLLGPKGKAPKGQQGGPSDSKMLFQRFGQIVHALHGHGQQPQGGQQQMGSVGPPPSPGGAVEGDEGVSPGFVPRTIGMPAEPGSGPSKATPMGAPPSFSSITSAAFPSPEQLENERQARAQHDAALKEEEERNKAEADAAARAKYTMPKPAPAVKPTPPPKFEKLGPGQELFDASGKMIASVPAIPKIAKTPAPPKGKTPADPQKAILAAQKEYLAELDKFNKWNTDHYMMRHVETNPYKESLAQKLDKFNTAKKAGQSKMTKPPSTDPVDDLVGKYASQPQ